MTALTYQTMCSMWGVWASYTGLKVSVSSVPVCLLSGSEGKKRLMERVDKAIFQGKLSSRNIVLTTIAPLRGGRTREEAAQEQHAFHDSRGSQLQ